ncbi:MAG: hypothetical protein CMJ05_01500 [Pelagibacterales bacterium]|nr:hypothetical protein [Pelagibacterales bacterium]|tara:strand:- start:11563 stop:12924 length:1362 start_codon:yes stop_codon:yes gene_type:complete
MINNFRKFISKYLSIYIQDFLKGTYINKSYKNLLISQNWSEQKMNNYQLKKLQDLFEFCVLSNDFYKKKYKDLSDAKFKINDLSDLRKLPILKKEDLRLNSLLSKNLNMRFVSSAKTGGSTGPPTVIYKDIHTRSIAWGAWFRWYNWIGIERGDPCMTLWGSSQVLSRSFYLKIYNRIISFLENDYRVNSFKINNSTINKIIRNIFNYKPVIIKGYLSAILQLADHIKSKKINYNPKCISTTSETLLPPYKEYIQKTFNCPVYDQYASTEISGVAFECKAQNGLHITSEHVIVEVVDDNNQPVFNKKGRIIITDLDNKAMPFIRYEIGDVGILSTETCSCGNKSYLLKSIEGRLADNIVLKDGSQVHGVFFTDIMYELKSEFNFNRISRFQAVQNKKGFLEFRLETTIKHDHDYCINLKNALLSFFHSVEIKTFKQLDNEPSGKFKYVISNLK